MSIAKRNRFRADGIPFTPPAGMTSTDVQTAIEEAAQKPWQIAAQVPFTPAGGMTSTNAQAAIEEAYTHAGGAAASAGVYYARAYGCVDDGKVNASGKITAGSNVLDLGFYTANGTYDYSGIWKFSAADVGKSIVLWGCGAAGAQLTTTIASYVSPTQVTLTASASTTVLKDMPVAWGTDNTAAFQSMLNTLLSPMFTGVPITNWSSGITRIVFEGLPQGANLAARTGRYLFLGGVTIPQFSNLQIAGDHIGPAFSFWYEGNCGSMIMLTSLATSFINYTGWNFNFIMEDLIFYWPCQTRMIPWPTTHAPVVQYPPLVNTGAGSGAVSGGAFRRLAIWNAYDFLTNYAGFTSIIFTDLWLGIFHKGFDTKNIFDVNYYHNIFFQILYSLIEGTSFRPGDWDNVVGKTSTGRTAFTFGYADEQIMSNIFMMSGYAGVYSYLTDTGRSDGMGGTIQGGPYGEISNVHFDSVTYGFINEAPRSAQAGWKVTNYTWGGGSQAVWFKYAAAMSFPFMWTGGGIYGNATPANVIKEDTNAEYDLKIFGVRGMPDIQVTKAGGVYQPPMNFSVPQGWGIGILQPKQPLHVNGYIKVGSTNWFGTTPTGGEVKYDSTNGPMMGYDFVNGGWSAMSNSGLTTLTVNSATPPVAGGKSFKTANTAATSITNFTGGLAGQEIKIIFTDANTTIVESATIKLNGTGNFVSTADDTMTLICDGTAWYEITRSVN